MRKKVDGGWLYRVSQGLREICVELYLWVWRVAFIFLRLLPLRNKVVFVDSFGQNSVLVYDEMQRRNLNVTCVFLRAQRCVYARPPKATIITLRWWPVWDWIRNVYHLATARVVFVDNYFPFLAVVRFRPEVRCIQLWHAAGAIKAFGLRAVSTCQRSERARRRFVRVYNRFDKVVVGSDAMAHVFKQAFGIGEDRILRTGFPRTDPLYDMDWGRETAQRLVRENPALASKRVLLYAPTYRDHELDCFRMQLDLDKMYAELREDHVLVLRLHPAVKHREDYERRYPGFVYDYTDYPDINDLLWVTDCLITDYSSVIYEYALLGRPMVFFPYDLEEYVKDRGLWGEYSTLVPGPIVRSTAELIECLRANRFDMDRIRAFAEEWNEFSRGTACANLVTFLEQHYLTPVGKVLTNAENHRLSV